jgi:hypothetical protein
MNVKESLDLLMARLGNRTSTVLRTNCLREMKVVQEQLEGAETLPWFIISEEATAVTTEEMIGDPRLPLPTDFIREVEDDNLWYVEDDGTLVEIAKVGYDEGRAQIDDNAEPGTPSLFSIRGEDIILRPAPDRVMTFRLPSYYAKQDPPSDDVLNENGWFKWVPDLMIAKTGVVVAGHYLKDQELVGLFGAEQQRAVQRLANLETAREEANRSRRMG